MSDCIDLPESLKNFNGNLMLNCCCCCKGGNNNSDNNGKSEDSCNNVGEVAYFAMQEAPEGWLRCDGAEIPRDKYKRLFEAISTVFGEGDGQTTFNLPDLRGEFIRSYDESGLIDKARIFGSNQKASVIVGDPAKTRVDIVTLYNTLNDDTADFQVRAGIEEINPSEYPGINVAYTSNNNLSGYQDSNCMGAVRPRNVALLACIKY